MLFLTSNFTANAAENGVISGKIIDEITTLPIAFAGVYLYLPNSELPINTIQTDENGFFKFSGLKSGLYKLKISYVGYTPLIITDILIANKDFEHKLGTLKLSNEQNNLAEVSITVDKPTVEFTADIITYNVGKSVLSEGSTAIDILKNVPMVQLDIDGKATIAGKRNTRVFIDGKPSDYMAANITDLLNVLPADAIEKIEVMTNPPAKYAGDGEGIINIVMKKGFKIGFNGSAGIAAGLQGNVNANTNATYRGKNYALNGNLSIRQNIGENTNESYRKNFFADTIFYNNINGNSRNLGQGGNFRAGLEWTINAKQSLKIGTNYNLNNNNNVAKTVFHFLNQAQQETRLQNQINTNNGNGSNGVFNADYTLKTDTSGGKLEIGITLNANSNTDERQFNRSYVLPINLSQGLQENNNNLNSNGINFNLDYDKPLFKKRAQLALGLAFNYRNNDNNLLVQNFNFTTQQYSTNISLSNQFFYKESILAAYAAYSYKQKGWALKAGLRAEITAVNFTLATINNYNLKPYLSLFPSFSVNRFFGKKYNLGLNYSLRISRPRENALNPQINNADPLNISYGNPNLSPAYTQQIELNFSVIAQKWSFTPRLSFASSKNIIENFRTVLKTGVSERTFGNIGANHSFALIVIGNYKASKKITSNANFSIIQSSYTSRLNTSLNRKGLSFRSALGFSVELPLKIAAETNLNYANNLGAQGRNRNSINNSFAARKLFLKNTLSARIIVNDIFRPQNNTIFNQGDNFTLESYGTNNSNNVTLNLNYRFTKVKNK